MLVLLGACANRPGGGEGSDGGAGRTTTDGDAPAADMGEGGAASEGAEPGEGVVANVESVEVSGSAGAYTFGVTVRSPDAGCDRYADWWEVIDAEGGLVYRRILAHSHVDEQPFTRSGGPVEVQADAELWVRAHMHGEGTSAEGYGGQVLVGSVAGGFVVGDGEGLAALHEAEPLPDGCAF